MAKKRLSERRRDWKEFLAQARRLHESCDAVSKAKGGADSSTMVEVSYFDLIEVLEYVVERRDELERLVKAYGVLECEGHRAER
jgi:hypothetical protein